MNIIQTATKLTSALQNDCCEIIDTNAQVKSVVPAKKIQYHCSEQLDQIADTQPLQLRECIKQNYLQLNFNDLERRYDIASVETIEKIYKTISNLNTEFSNINLIWDEKKSVFKILGSAQIPQYLMWELIKSNNYSKWYPQLHRVMDEDYEITLEVNRQFEYSGIKKTYTPSLASSTGAAYPLSSTEYLCAYSDSTIYETEYLASYVNADSELIQNATVIGNQKFIPIAQIYYKSAEILEEDKFRINFNKLEYIATFLQQNNYIKYIVDVGCGDVSISLILQKILQREGLNVTVFPIDIHRDPNAIIPFNLLPAQCIKDADPSVTAFTVIRSFISDTDVLEDDKSYYIYELIKNNPGCFVLATQDNKLSNPNKYIPHEFVYTKKLFLSCDSKDLYLEQVVKKINDFFEGFLKNKYNFVDVIELIKIEKTNNRIFCDLEYYFGLDSFFHLCVHLKLLSKNVNYLEFLRKTIKNTCWWHVYKS